jgi:WD40 repeat protein
VSECKPLPDGTRLATAAQDGTVRVWGDVDGDEWQLVASLEGHSYAVTSCAWSPDGSRLASTSGPSQADDDARSQAECSVIVWEANTWGRVTTLEGHENNVCSCAFSPYGARLASASDDETICVWDANTWHELARLEAGTCTRSHFRST